MKRTVRGVITAFSVFLRGCGTTDKETAAGASHRSTFTSSVGPAESRVIYGPGGFLRAKYAFYIPRGNTDRYVPRLLPHIFTISGSLTRAPAQTEILAYIASADLTRSCPVPSLRYSLFVLTFVRCNTVEYSGIYFRKGRTIPRLTG